MPALQRGRRSECVNVTDGDRWYGHVPSEKTQPGSHAGWVHFGKSAASLTVDPTNADRWFMTDWYAVWRSEDAGRSWALAIDGIENTVSHDMAGQPGMPNVVHWAMGDNGYLRSTDGGAELPQDRLPSQAAATSRTSAKRRRTCNGSTPPPTSLRVSGKLPSWLSADDAGETWHHPAMKGLPSDMGDLRRMNSVTVDPNDADRILVGVTMSRSRR